MTAGRPVYATDSAPVVDRSGSARPPCRCSSDPGYWLGADVRLRPEHWSVVEPVAHRVAERYRTGDRARMKFDLAPGWTYESVCRRSFGAEYAVALLTGEPWNAGNEKLPDVGADLEVRWTSMVPPTLRAYDRDYWRYRVVLTSSVGPLDSGVYRVHGWSFVWEIRRYGERRPGYLGRFLPALHLLPFHDVAEIWPP